MTMILLFLSFLVAHVFNLNGTHAILIWDVDCSQATEMNGQKNKG
jgi:hypothetical protein